MKWNEKGSTEKSDNQASFYTEIKNVPSGKGREMLKEPH